VPGITDVPGVEVWGKGRGEFLLPCGFVMPDGKAHKKVVFRESKGREEDILGDESVLRSTRTTDVLTSCIEQLGPVVEKDQIRLIVADELPNGCGITSTDRIAAMIFLRRVSVGDMYKITRPCPRIGCGHEPKNKQLDLRTIKMTEVPLERVGKRRVRFKLPRSEKEITLRVMTAKHEEELFTLRPTQPDVRSAAICARVESLGDEIFVDPVRKMAAVKELPLADRNRIREVYDMIEADVDTSIEVTCENPLCNYEYSFPLDVGQSFFSTPGVGGVDASSLTWL